MDLNINEFKHQLENEIAKGKTDAEIAAFIHREIRQVEMLKASLMEEMNDSTKDFLNNATVRVDTYLFQLHELEHNIKTGCLTLDQKVALNDTQMREEIAEKMEELHAMDPEKYSEEGIINPTENDPENEDQ